MSFLIRAKTDEGTTIKNLAELLQSNLRTACFVSTPTGITLRMMDSGRTILIDLELLAEAFSIYRLNVPNSDRLRLGVNLAHFHKMVKSLKKKDAVELFSKEEKMDELGITIFPKDGGRLSTGYMTLQNIQNIDIDLPDGYGNPIAISTAEFQKMCKCHAQISNTTRVTAKEFVIKFSSDAGGVMKRDTEFGEIDNDEKEEKDESNDEKVLYEDDFDTEQFTKILKIAGLNPKVSVYAKTGLPLLFRTSVGRLGRISLYLKSKSLQEADSRTVDDEN